MSRAGLWLRRGKAAAPLPLAAPASERAETAPRLHPVALAALLICLMGLYLRVLNARTDLGSPGVDENDVVQQAVAFMGGDWRYYLLEYGALPTYVLAGIYHLVGRLHGLDGFQYAQRVFFDSEELYFVGRLYCAACYAVLALVSYRVLAARFGRSAGLVSAALLALPTMDSSTNGTARIDVMQGAWQVACMFCLVRALESKQLRHWLWAGVAAGLGVASKPLPGLLIAPCFLAASWFATEQAEAPAGGALLRAARSALATLFRPALWASALAALGAACLANPTALDLAKFVRAQRDAAGYYSGARAPGAHYDAFQASVRLGAPFLAAAALSVCALVFVRDARARLLALFPLVYVTGFVGRPVRFYYLVSPAMAACVVIGVAVGLALSRAGLDAPSGRAGAEPPPPQPLGRRRWLAALIGLCLAPVLAYAPVSRMEYLRHVTSDASLMHDWIEEHVPSGASIFHFGGYAAGPRLVVDSWKRQSQLSDFFDYGRDQYDFYQRAFRQAHAEYLSAGRPHYALEIHNGAPEPAASRKNARWLTHTLDQRALSKGQEYILLAGFGGPPELSALGYAWLPRVELAQQFGRQALFRVPTPAVSPPDSAAADAAVAAPAVPAVAGSAAADSAAAAPAAAAPGTPAAAGSSGSAGL
jgi:hypothetical protein